MDTLLPIVESYLRRHKMSATRFGRITVGDANLVSQMRKGRILRAGTAEKVIRFMRASERPRVQQRRRR